MNTSLETLWERRQLLSESAKMSAFNHFWGALEVLTKDSSSVKTEELLKALESALQFAERIK